MKFDFDCGETGVPARPPGVIAKQTASEDARAPSKDQKWNLYFS